MPGTSGFPAEFLLLMSALNAHLGAGVLALLTMVLAAAYGLDGYRRAFFGPPGYKAIGTAADLRPRELGVALTCCLTVLVLGLWLDLVLGCAPRARSGWHAWRGGWQDPEPALLVRLGPRRGGSAVLQALVG